METAQNEHGGLFHIERLSIVQILFRFVKNKKKLYPKRNKANLQKTS